jgi:hypothetical protein
VGFSVPPHGYPGIDRLLPDYTQVDVDRSAPTPSTSASAGGGGMDEVNRLGDTLSSKVSADGTRMVTMNSAKQVVVWTIDGDRVRSTPLTNLFNPNDFTEKVTISRSGRYLAFVQSVWPPPLDTRANAPVDEEGLPKINPDNHHTCKLNSIADVVTCLVVYDIEAGRVTAAIPLGGESVFVSMISIDPDDQVVAAVLPGSFTRASVQASENALRRWDLRTGREWDPLRIPWRSWLITMWLRPGGTAAVAWEAMPDSTGIRPDHTALTLVDLGPAPSRRELADNTLDAAISLDGRTLAAIETPRDQSSFRATVGHHIGRGHHSNFRPVEATGRRFPGTDPQRHRAGPPLAHPDGPEPAHRRSEDRASHQAAHRLVAARRRPTARARSRRPPLGTNGSVGRQHGRAVRAHSHHHSRTGTAAPRPSATAAPDGQRRRQPLKPEQRHTDGPVVRRAGRPEHRQRGAAAAAARHLPGAAMPELMSFPVDAENSVLVEVDLDQPEIGPVSRTGDLIKSATTSFDGALTHVRKAASIALANFRDMDVRPDEIQVEFGVKLNARPEPTQPDDDEGSQRPLWIVDSAHRELLDKPGAARRAAALGFVCFGAG